MTHPTPSSCLGDGHIADLLDGRAPNDALARAEVHAAGCESCRRVLVAAAKVRHGERRDEAAERTQPNRVVATTGDDAFGDVLHERLGDIIGRYRIESVVGQGGMGIVYAARDDTLRRTVALKVLARDALGEDGPARLLREARAMASIDHPNVLSVHDVGLHDGLVYIVMDLVEGGDLRRWLREGEHLWRDIVAVFVAAGRGLSAIHRTGLVHRDFKPANVLVGPDRRVQITDFGLVGSAASTQTRPDTSLLRGVLGDDRTETGRIVGTPRYMSPEQISGAPVDALSDQFSFCVSLWEAVTHSHPFGNGTLVDRFTRMKQGIAPEAEGPPELLAVLRRGLAADPTERFASMDDLVSALERAGERKQRRRRATAASLVVMGALGVGVQLGGSTRDNPCPDPPEDELAGIWDDATRAAIVDRLAGPRDDVEWERFVGLVDGYTTRWSEARREACLDTRVRGHVSEEMLDRRTACLNRARAGLGAAVDVLRSSDGGQRPELIGLALQLPDLGRCSDLAALGSVDPRPGDPQIAAAIDALDADNVAAATLAFAGRVEEAERRVEQALPRARELGWAPLTAGLLDRRALLTALRDPKAGVAVWREAYVLAATAGDLVAFEVGVDGAQLLIDAERLDEAAFMIDVAAAHADSLGGEPRPGELSSIRALLAIRRGDFAAGIEHTRNEVDTRSMAEDRAGQARALSNLTGLLAGSGRAAEALEVGARALEVSTAVYGASHPQTIRTLHNHAYVLYALGRYDDAKPIAEDCLARLVTVELPRERARTLGLLGDLALAQGDLAEALGHFDMALELAVETRAPFGQVAYLRSKKGSVLLEAKRYADAIVELNLAAEEVGDSGGEAVIVADTYAKLAFALRGHGDRAAQREAARTAYEVGRELPDHHGGLALHAYAVTLADEDRLDDALTVFDEAVSGLALLQDAAPRFQASILLDRAEVLDRLGRTDRAGEDVDHARELLDTAGDRDNDEWARVQAWPGEQPRSD